MVTSTRVAPLVALAFANLCCAAAAPVAAPVAPAEAPAAPAPEPAAVPPPPSATLLSFLALGRGDQLADLGSGSGYSLLPFADAVGPYGRVYARHAPKVSQHLPSNAVYETPPESLPANVVLLATPLDAPLPPDVKQLDVVTFLFGYQALVTERRDRARFNAAVLRALKPGGLYVIAERSGSGAELAVTGIRGEVESAGFRFLEAADSLPSGIDDGSADASGAPTSVLKFQKAP